MITQEKLDRIWQKHQRRIDNDGEPDVVIADFYEEISELGGMTVQGSERLGGEESQRLLDFLQGRGCAVLDDPAREGEPFPVLIFLPGAEDDVLEPCATSQLAAVE